MGNSDTAKNEERGEAGKGEEPVENVSTTWGQIDECQAPEEKLK
jgi:hypothetical protein